jgi:hypothetical protein
VFSNFSNAVNDFRFALPGKSGQRSELRGPGFFQIDAGVGKIWKVTESQRVEFRGKTFKVVNNVRFEIASATANNLSLANSTNFGKFTQTLIQPHVFDAVQFLRGR